MKNNILITVLLAVFIVSTVQAHDIKNKSLRKLKSEDGINFSNNHKHSLIRDKKARIKSQKISGNMMKSATGKIILDSLIYRIKDEDGLFWENDEKEVYTYNTDNKLLLIDYYLWEASYWDYIEKDEFFLDETGNDTLILTYYNDGSGWEKDYKFVSEYDLTGNLILETTYNWDGASWIFVENYQFGYDDNHKCIWDIWQGWDEDLEVWDNWVKYTINFENELVISDTNYLYDSDLDEWVYNGYSEYNYDAKGHLLLQTDYYYNDISEVWENDSKSVLEYNLIDNYSIETDFTWDDVEQDYVNYYKYICYYDTAYVRADLILPYDELFTDQFFIYKLNSYQDFSWDIDLEEWVDEDSVPMFYSGGTSIISIKEETKKPALIVTPNPASENITIYIEVQNREFEVFIYNIIGEEIYKNTINNSEQIPVSNFSEGTYILKVIDQYEKVYTEKFIKK